MLGFLAASPRRSDGPKLELSETALLDDPMQYRRRVAKLLYLYTTRLAISSVHTLSQFMAKPRADHLVAAHKVLRYVKNAPAQGLLYSASSPLQL